MEQQISHWTEENSDALAHRLAFDFIAQVESRLDALCLNQAGLAKKLGVSEGAVSKLLNNPQNLTIRTIAKYSRALGINAAIVAYDNGGSGGPINPTVFTACWEKLGKPVDMWDFEGAVTHSTSAHIYINVEINLYARQQFWINQPAQYGVTGVASWGNTAALWASPNFATSLYKYTNA